MSFILSLSIIFNVKEIDFLVQIKTKLGKPQKKVF